MAKEKVLTMEILDYIGPGSVFKKGVIRDAPGGLNMTGSGKWLAWLAVKGHGPCDWCIYAHWSNRPDDYILKNGDKVTMSQHIRKLVPCTDEVFAKYRY